MPSPKRLACGVDQVKVHVQSGRPRSHPRRGLHHAGQAHLAFHVRLRLGRQPIAHRCGSTRSAASLGLRSSSAIIRSRPLRGELRQAIL